MLTRHADDLAEAVEIRRQDCDYRLQQYISFTKKENQALRKIGEFV